MKIKDVPYADLEKQWSGMLHRFLWRIEGLDPEDILQELRIVLMKAQQKYDPTKGVAFSTYLYRACKNRVGKLRHQALNVKKRVPPSQQIVFCTNEHVDDVTGGLKWCSTCRQLPNVIDNTEVFELLLDASENTKKVANQILLGYRTRRTWEENGMTPEQIKDGVRELRTLLRAQKVA